MFRKSRDWLDSKELNKIFVGQIAVDFQFAVNQVEMFRK